MYIEAYPRDSITTSEVEEAIYKELEKLATEPVTGEELNKIKNNIEADMIWASYRNIGLADYLAEAQTMARDWKYLYRLRDMHKNVTADDIMRVSGQYLTEQSRTVATLIPTVNGEEQ